MNPNKTFTFDVKDIDLIENGLRKEMNHLQHNGNPETAMYVYKLLGRIHDQKSWFRPKKDYVGG